MASAAADRDIEHRAYELHRLADDKITLINQATTAWLEPIFRFRCSRAEYSSPSCSLPLAGRAREGVDQPACTATKNQRDFARSLRNEPTSPEKRLWHFLRAEQLSNHKFRRQAAIGPYIVDFV